MTLPDRTHSQIAPPFPIGFDTILDYDSLSKICESARVEGADFSEVYVERRLSTWITLVEDKINVVRVGVKAGAGVRVIRGTHIGYAYCEELRPASIGIAAKTAAYISHEDNPEPFSNPVNIARPQKNESVSFYQIEADAGKKTDLLRRANSAARDEDKRVTEVSCSYYDEVKEIRIVNSDGLRCDDQRSLYGLHVFVLTADGGSNNSGYATGGGRYPFTYFEKRTPEMIARDASRQALRKLRSCACPAGQFPVVINKGWGGVLIHEAVGHGLESDFNRRGSSVYTGKIGQKIASEYVTIIDDGTIPNGRGSSNTDDEGTITQKNILIENGILQNYLYDKYNAHLMKAAPTGNGRRENFTQLPMPRMTNTYITRGNDDPEDLIHSVKCGLYVQTLGGGQVDIASGNFVFEVQEGYWIENGKITYPVLGANLIGHGPDILNKIDGVGYDLEIETGAGTCSKEGQAIHVGVGQPTIKIGKMTIGGTRLKMA
ncbi:TldD/PmbA family protein [bacterium]|nr:TldD/PmbA family protein [bacterium]